MGIFRRLFHLYRGEEVDAGLFALLAYLWAVAATCGNKLAEAQFLVHVGADFLPRAYIMTACASMATAGVFLYAFHYWRTHQVFLGFLTVAASFYAGVAICFRLGVGQAYIPFWFGLKIAGYPLLIAAFTSFWSFVDQFHTLQNAKRLFCLISSAIFLGFATSGALIHSSLGPTILYWLITALFCLGGLLVRYILKRSSQPKGISSLHSSQPFFVRDCVRQIMASPYTILLITADLLIQLMTFIAEFNYMSAFEVAFPPELDQAAGLAVGTTFTQFFGRLVAIMGVSNLIFGLFFYSRLVRRFGVNNLDVTTDVLFLILFLLWPLTGGLICPIFGFFLVEGMLWVLDDNNFNLQLNGVPGQLKYKIRALIESFFEPVGILLSGILLTVAGSRSLHFGILIATLAVAVSLSLRHQYPRAIMKRLAENAIHFRRSAVQWLHSMTAKQRRKEKARMLELLQKRDPDAQMLACEAMLATNDPILLKKLFQSSSELTDAVKIKLLEFMHENPSQATEEDPAVLPELMKKTLSTHDHQLRLHYLQTIQKIGDSTVIEPLISGSLRFLPREKRIIENMIVTMGNKNVLTLLALFSDIRRHDRVRLLAGRILGRLAPTTLRKHLYTIIQKEIDWAYFYFYHAHTIDEYHHDQDLTMVKKALHTSFHTVVDFIIQILGAAGKLEDCELLSRTLFDPDEKIRSQATETIERSCDTKIFRLLRPLVTDIPHHHKIRACQKQGCHPLSLAEILERLAQSSAYSNQLVASLFQEKQQVSINPYHQPHFVGV